MLAHKAGLPNMKNPHRRLKHFPISPRVHELDKEWVSYDEWWKKLVIMEYGEKIMEDGLATKDSSFLVD